MKTCDYCMSPYRTNLSRPAQLRENNGKFSRATYRLCEHCRRLLRGNFRYVKPAPKHCNPILPDVRGGVHIEIRWDGSKSKLRAYLPRLGLWCQFPNHLREEGKVYTANVEIICSNGKATYARAISGTIYSNVQITRTETRLVG